MPLAIARLNKQLAETGVRVLARVSKHADTGNICKGMHKILCRKAMKQCHHRGTAVRLQELWLKCITAHAL